MRYRSRVKDLLGSFWHLDKFTSSRLNMNSDTAYVAVLIFIHVARVIGIDNSVIVTGTTVGPGFNRIGEKSKGAKRWFNDLAPWTCFFFLYLESILCPATHPYSFDLGTKCCKSYLGHQEQQGDNGDCQRLKQSSWIMYEDLGHDCCFDGDFIDCPGQKSGRKCRTGEGIKAFLHLATWADCQYHLQWYLPSVQSMRHLPLEEEPSAVIPPSGTVHFN